MLKQTIQFEDFDGVNRTKNLYFNLNRDEIVMNFEIQKEFEDVQDMIGGRTRDLQMHEIRMILELVKKLMRLSYGLQKNTEDGDLRFSKKPEIWEEFTETAAYDAFLFGLFEDTNKAVHFLVNIWPKEIRPDEDQLKFPGMPVQDAKDIPANGNDWGPQKASLASVPDADETLKALHDYTQQELLDMSTEDFQRLAGKDPQRMDQYTLQIAMHRKNAGKD